MVLFLRNFITHCKCVTPVKKERYTM